MKVVLPGARRRWLTEEVWPVFPSPARHPARMTLKRSVATAQSGRCAAIPPSTAQAAYRLWLRVRAHRFRTVVGLDQVLQTSFCEARLLLGVEAVGENGSLDDRV